ncbi:MAG: HDOD domain-containing protein [Syntrophobacterales bacterium]|nr:HDOD domain-containing protein [Syntrophobacterales bacterium]
MNLPTLLKKIVMLTGDLPTIPYTSQAVLQKLSDPNATPKEIESIILRDPSLAARILKLANSPFYAHARKIKTVSEATAIIGFNTLRSLVIASAVREMFKVFGLVEKLLWEHSVAVGFISRFIASKKFVRISEEVFIAGLLHDIGKIVLQLRVPDKMCQVIEELYEGGREESTTLETKLFGFNHAHVGQLVARKWLFSEDIEEAIGYHHWPGRARLNPNICYVVHLANVISHKLEIGPIRTPEIDLSKTISAISLGFFPDDLDGMLEECQQMLKVEAGDIFS